MSVRWAAALGKSRSAISTNLIPFKALKMIEIP